MFLKFHKKNDNQPHSINTMLKHKKIGMIAKKERS